jgi:hypothetical protein
MTDSATENEAGIGVVVAVVVAVVVVVVTVIVGGSMDWVEIVVFQDLLDQALEARSVVLVQQRQQFDVPALVVALPPLRGPLALSGYAPALLVLVDVLLSPVFPA